jgi:flagellar biogenesis protein FliO
VSSNLECLGQESLGQDRLGQDSLACWEKTASVALAKTLTPAPHVPSQTASSIGIFLGLVGLIWSISNLYQRQRKIKYQQRVSILERSWLISSCR